MLLKHASHNIYYPPQAVSGLNWGTCRARYILFIHQCHLIGIIRLELQISRQVPIFLKHLGNYVSYKHGKYILMELSRWPC